MKENQGNKITIISQQQALDKLKEATPDTPIILDFDETVFLRNSTAEYLNSLRPRLIGLLLVICLKIIRPWNWLPPPFKGNQVKDWFLVIIPTILLPWSLFFWRAKAPQLAKDYGNLELINAVKDHPSSNIVVASLGFNFIIMPILQHLPLQHNSLIGCRFWQGAFDRSKGKLLMSRQALSDSTLAAAILITDSPDDLPFLEIVAKPCLVVWHEAKYIPPFQDLYPQFIRRNNNSIVSN
ncbi:hypothetical protein NIES4102_13600 [Chondrocystis sp. NIES-4102]|nr:hypothetical protein NIES4102_13600 [Chondrocystis sp. NIES-4102]